MYTKQFWKVSDILSYYHIGFTLLQELLDFYELKRNNDDTYLKLERTKLQISADVLCALYCDECLSKKEICKKLKISQSVLNQLIESYNLSRDEEKFKQKKSKLSQETVLDRYGVSYIGQSQQVKDKVKETCKERYGCEYAFQSESVKQKIRETNLNKYGVENPAVLEETKEKQRQTSIEHYGVPNPSQSDEVKDKMHQIFQQRYGVDNPFQSDEVKEKSKQTNQQALGIPFPMQSDVCKEKSRKTNLGRYGVENPMQNPDVVARVQKTKLQRYGYIKNMKLNIFDWCRTFTFPYPIIPDEVVDRSWKNLQQTETSDFSTKSRHGMKIVSRFHRSIWKCNKQGKPSPYDAWQDDDLLNRCIDNRLIYIGDSLDPSRVLAGFSASGIAPKVSAFNPFLAKYLVSKYLNSYDVIFDPCSGFSGRMLGSCATGKKYIGQDINPTVVDESNQIIDYLKINASVSCIDSTNSSGEYPCLFTCSPYSDKENWNQKIKNYTCDEWIDICLKNYQCSSYLFVVDKTEKYQDKIVETINNRSHLNQSQEFVILIRK